MSDSEFLGDTQNLIRPEREFNPQLGYDLVRSQLIDRLQNSISIKVTPEKKYCRYLNLPYNDLIFDFCGKPARIDF